MDPDATCTRWDQLEVLFELFNCTKWYILISEALFRDNMADSKAYPKDVF